MDKMAIRAKQVTNKETIKDKRQTDKKTKRQIIGRYSDK